jgi:hypothetical protein
MNADEHRLTRIGLFVFIGVHRWPKAFLSRFAAAVELCGAVAAVMIEGRRV